MFLKQKESLEIQKIKQLTGHRSSIYCLVDIPGEDRFLSAGGDGWIVSWDKDGNEENGNLLASVEGKIFSMFYDSVKNLLLVGDMDGHLYWIDYEKKTILKRLVIHKGSIFGIKILDNKVWTCGGDGVLCKTNIDTMLPEISVRLSNQGLRCFEFVGNKIIVGGSDKSLQIVNTETLKTENHIKNAHGNTIFSLLYDGNDHIYSGGRDAILKKWSAINFVEELQIPAHWFTVNKIIKVAQNYIATVSRDKTLRIWDKNTLLLVKSLDITKGGHINSVNDVVFFTEKRMLATASDDKSIILWKIT